MDLCAVDCGLLHFVDFLRQRWPRCCQWHLIFKRLYWPNSGLCLWPASATQNAVALCQRAHHFNCRLHLRPLWQNQGLAGLVTIIAVLGIMPYISLQLKAVSASLELLNNYPAVLPSLHEKLQFGTDNLIFSTPHGAICHYFWHAMSMQRNNTAAW